MGQPPSGRNPTAPNAIHIPIKPIPTTPRAMPNKPIIAIQRDRYKTKEAGIQSFSERWADQLLASGDFEPKLVNVLADGNLSCVADSSAFMARPMGSNINYDLAKKIIPALEHGMQIPTFPSAHFAWLSRDKANQSYWLDASGIPTPSTWHFLDRDSARRFIHAAEYPLVSKLTDGSQSDEVVLLHDPEEATSFAEEMFSYGITHMYQARGNPRRRFLQRIRQAQRFVQGRQRPGSRKGGYVYFQEFLEGNDFDTRVTVIGQFAVAFRRFNRKNDFRASGSGYVDHEGRNVDRGAIELAFRVADHLRFPFVAVDVLYNRGRPTVCELNLGYLADAIEKTSGCWHRHDDTNGPGYRLDFVEGPVDPYRLTLDQWLSFSGLLPGGGGDRMSSAPR